MTNSVLSTDNFEERYRQVSCRGVTMVDGSEFDSFMSNDVSGRLHDEDGVSDFEENVRGVLSTGFAQDNLSIILAATIPESRDWAIGEAMAEAYLSRECNVTWPWNMERDKRNPNASLPGADLIGFEIKDGSIRLVLGEVKTSSDASTPPGVMSGRHGMVHQIDKLATNLGLVCQILKWLYYRCKSTEHEPSFNEAIGLFLNSGFKNIVLFGVLIRDTHPNVLDLRARGQSLSSGLDEPTTCQLIAIHLPCAISDLGRRVEGGRS